MFSFGVGAKKLTGFNDERADLVEGRRPLDRDPVVVDEGEFWPVASLKGKLMARQLEMK